MNTKTLTFLSALILTTLQISAQNLGIMYPMDESKVFTTNYYDAKGELCASSSFHISNYKGNLTNGSVDLIYNFKDTKGGDFFSKPAEYVVKMKREGGKTSMEMPGLTRLMKVNSYMPAGDPVSVPSKLSVGQKLPDSVVQVHVGKMNPVITVSNRSVKDHRKITTKAGTFDCWLVHEIASTKSPMGTSVIEKDTWYSDGVGIVKESIYDSKGNLVSSSEIVKISK